VSDPYKADDVETLIQEFERSGARELHLRCEQFELYLSSDPNSLGIESAAESHHNVAASAAVGRSTAAVGDSVPSGHAGAARAAAAASASVDAQLPSNAVIVRAPYLGTFYRSPKPGAKPYVEIGDAVGAETDLCLVEVMKLFTAVRAGTDGRVHAILAKDGQLVEGDQPLFALVPG
jgi:acetyl-CoA carboxylase biotin carboxyl carrier protein